MPAQLKLVLGVCHVGVQITRTVIGAHIIKAVLGGKANILRGIVVLVADRLTVIGHAQKLRIVTAVAAVGRSLQHVLLVSTRACPRVPVNIDVLVGIGGLELLGPIGRPVLGETLATQLGTADGLLRVHARIELVGCHGKHVAGVRGEVDRAVEVVGDVLLHLGGKGVSNMRFLAVGELTVAHKLDGVEFAHGKLEARLRGGGELAGVAQHVAVVHLGVGERGLLTRRLGDRRLQLARRLAITVGENVLGDDDLNLALLIVVLARKREREPHLDRELVGFGHEGKTRRAVVIDVIGRHPGNGDVLDALVVARDGILIISLWLLLALLFRRTQSRGRYLRCERLFGLRWRGNELDVRTVEVGGVDDAG
ncbi:MAG: hypothetical protein DBY41_01420 [Clostridium sp.]|nr:MAG: hypothetical protein DBY41_01420 [Clostridium sp.]